VLGVPWPPPRRLIKAVRPLGLAGLSLDEQEKEFGFLLELLPSFQT
jgi:hypothetical protein